MNASYWFSDGKGVIQMLLFWLCRCMAVGSTTTIIYIKQEIQNIQNLMNSEKTQNHMNAIEQNADGISTIELIRIFVK